LDAVGEGIRVAVSGLYSGPAISAIDDKGRLAVPANLRNSIPSEDGEPAAKGGRTLCITRHERSDCLIAFGPDRLRKMQDDIEREEEIALARGEDYDRDAANRRKFGLVETVTLDGSGRFVVPPFLRQVGKLDRQVFFHGAGEYFEIWNPDLLLAEGDDGDPIKLACRFYLAAAEKKK